MTISADFGMPGEELGPPWLDDAEVRHFREVPAWGWPLSLRSLPELPVSELNGAGFAWACEGSTGAGVRICLLDSGVDSAHPAVPAVEGQWQVSCIDGQVRVVPAEHSDPSGHGTACASLIGSVAPDVSLSSVRVLSGGNAGSGQTLIAALRWAIDEGFALIHLSLATNKPYLFDALRMEIERSYRRRCVMVASASNLPVASMPWRSPLTVSVASHDQPETGLVLANPRPPVDFFAPGVDVVVAAPGGGSVRTTGNSFAAPYVTGLAALTLAKRPWLTPFQLKAALFAMAANVSPHDTAQLRGLQ